MFSILRNRRLLWETLLLNVMTDRRTRTEQSHCAFIWCRVIRKYYSILRLRKWSGLCCTYVIAINIDKRTTAVHKLKCTCERNFFLLSLCWTLKKKYKPVQNGAQEWGNLFWAPFILGLSCKYLFTIFGSETFLWLVVGWSVGWFVGLSVLFA